MYFDETVSKLTFPTCQATSGHYTLSLRVFQTSEGKREANEERQTRNTRDASEERQARDTRDCVFAELIHHHLSSAKLVC